MCRSPRLSPSTTTHHRAGLEGASKQEGDGAGVLVSVVVVVGVVVKEKKS